MPPLMSLLFCKGEFEMFEMKESVYKNYGEAKVLGVSSLMLQPLFCPLNYR